jgi:hypothetical protein
MQPKFITFIQCTFDNKWRHVVGSDEGQERKYGNEKYGSFPLTETDANKPYRYELEGG